jgi:transposase
LAMWKLNPRKWLTWYFEHCAAAGGRVPADIQPFLPWNLSSRFVDLEVDRERPGG